MSSTSNNPWFFIGAAFVGVISAAGIFAVEHYRQERRRHAMAQDLSRLDRQLSVMRRELEELQSSQSKIASENKTRKHRRSKRVSSSVSVTTSEDFNSALDSSDLEFYDLSDEEESRASTITPYDSLVRDIDNKLDSNTPENFHKSLELLQDMCIEYPENPELLWRIGKCQHKLFSVCLKDSEKPVLINRGIQAIDQSFRINENIGEAHKWYAILVGSRSDFQGTKEKISDGHVFKKHLDIALSLNSEDPTLHHLLGRFAYEVSSLKWYERKAASALYGEPPTSSYQQAVEHLMDAERLAKHDWKENKLILAKCYIAMSDINEGVRWLVQADKILSEGGLDGRVDTEVKALLTKYNSYR